jgi:hypothetical protein
MVSQIPGHSNIKHVVSKDLDYKFLDFDCILVTACEDIDQARLGDALATAVDHGVTVVICTRANRSDVTYAKGRFEAQGYWPMAPGDKDEPAVELGTIESHKTVRSLTNSCAFQAFSTKIIP